MRGAECVLHACIRTIVYGADRQFPTHFATSGDIRWKHDAFSAEFVSEEAHESHLKNESTNRSIRKQDRVLKWGSMCK